MRSIFCIGLFVTALSSAACNSSGPPPKKDVIEQALAQPEVFILDVRSAGEFADGHVEGAVNLNGKDVSKVQTLLPNKSQQIVVHCKSGGRSAKASEMLAEMGYTNVLDAKSTNAVANALGKPLVK